MLYMSEIEILELSWYIRDHLFRRYNEEGKEIIADNIPVEMRNTYFRYKNSDLEYLKKLSKIVLERLKEASVLVPLDASKLKMNTKLNRFQCKKCMYVSYLTKKEAMKCLRCDSEELREFTGKRSQ